MFGVYPPLDLVHGFYTPTLVVQECPPLVVLADLISVPPLEVHQVCSSRLEIELPVVSGLPTVFTQFVQMVPHDLDLLVNFSSLLQLVDHNQLKI